MADNGFRSFRRDSPPRDADMPPRDNDPLAELARLIGQSGPKDEHGYGAAHAAQTYDEAAPAAELDWAAGDDRYGEESGYDQPRAANADGLRPAENYAGPAEGDHPDPRYQGGLASRQYSAPAPGLSAEPRLPRAGLDNAPRQEPPNNRQYAAPAPYGRGDTPEDYAHEDARSPRRSGTVIIVAVLGLAVLGTAGALGYRAMFGGSMISGLPPIIKPAAGPIKVQPNQQAQAGAPAAGDAAKKGGEQLVPHQEQPVNVQPANPVPRVVTTIPVVSNAPGAALPAGQPPAANQAPPPPAATQPAHQPPPMGAVNNPPPAPAATPAQPGAKQVHTVTIRPGHPAAGTPAPPVQPAAASRPAKPHEPARTPRQTAAAGPLSIVPEQENERRPAATPARTRTALAHSPTPLAARPTEATAGGGGYAVQVSSQRSEAEAQAAFRALQAKYPQQLGSRHAIVRRADLGSKGVYYRALVGPFASGEQAVEVCSKLKAAGGSCIIQRN